MAKIYVQGFFFVWVWFCGFFGCCFVLGFFVGFFFLLFGCGFFFFVEERVKIHQCSWKKASYMVNYHCAVNNQRGRDMQDFTQNLIGLYIFLSQKKWKLLGKLWWVGHVYGGMTTGVSPTDAPVRSEGDSSCVAEDITQSDWKRKRSSNCDTKRHCSKSLRAGVEQKEGKWLQLNICSLSMFHPCSSSVAQSIHHILA